MKASRKPTSRKFISGRSTHNLMTVHEQYTEPRMLSNDSDEGGQVGRKSIKGRSPSPFSPPFFSHQIIISLFCKPLSSALKTKASINQASSSNQSPKSQLSKSRPKINLLQFRPQNHHKVSILAIDKRPSSSNFKLNQKSFNFISTTSINTNFATMLNLIKINKHKMQKKARHAALTATVIKFMVLDHIHTGYEHRNIKYSATYPAALLFRIGLARA